ncbi:leucine-rich protein [Planoprotostelium fungivorum]|uniref:Leucine-rich protein n=1 Tax=Planoprotostelium fungivorum TaxID=1890364 RepID=A0A2P6N7U6_9EUKA|nr:leucine-rich protein [Planoprotostelium fungivorum]
MSIYNENLAVEASAQPTTNEQEDMVQLTEELVKSQHQLGLDASTVGRETVRYDEVFEATLRDVGIEKIENLNKFTHLKTVDLALNPIKKIENLNLDHLIELRLYNCQIERIQNLEGLKRLQNLYLHRNLIEKMEGFDHLPQLTELHLYENRIKKIEGLAACKKLTTLNLSTNQISKIEGLDHHPELTDLDLSHNTISHIEGVSKCGNLKELQLDDNKISSVEKISSKSVEHLDNGIRVLHPLNDKLPNLEVFDVAQNLIDDPEQFKKLSGSIQLVEIYVQGNVATSSASFRTLLIDTLPNLRQIDGLSVEEENLELETNDATEEEEGVFAPIRPATPERPKSVKFGSRPSSAARPGSASRPGTSSRPGSAVSNISGRPLMRPMSAKSMPAALTPADLAEQLNGMQLTLNQGYKEAHEQIDQLRHQIHTATQTRKFESTRVTTPPAREENSGSSSTSSKKLETPPDRSKKLKPIDSPRKLKAEGTEASKAPTPREEKVLVSLGPSRRPPPMEDGQKLGKKALGEIKRGKIPALGAGGPGSSPGGAPVLPSFCIAEHVVDFSSILNLDDELHHPSKARTPRFLC